MLLWAWLAIHLNSIATFIEARAYRRGIDISTNDESTLPICLHVWFHAESVMQGHHSSPKEGYSEHWLYKKKERCVLGMLSKNQITSRVVPQQSPREQNQSPSNRWPLSSRGSKARRQKGGNLVLRPRVSVIRVCHRPENPAGNREAARGDPGITYGAALARGAVVVRAAGGTGALELLVWRLRQPLSSQASTHQGSILAFGGGEVWDL